MLLKASTSKTSNETPSKFSHQRKQSFGINVQKKFVEMRNVQQELEKQTNSYDQVSCHSGTGNVNFRGLTNACNNFREEMNTSLTSGIKATNMI